MKKKLIYLIYSIIVVLVLSEITLSFTKHKRGFFTTYDNFQIVDSLVVYDFFDTDEYGIFKFSSWASDSAFKYFNPETSRIEHQNSEGQYSYWIEGMDEVYKDFYHLYVQIKHGSERFSSTDATSYNPEWNTEFPLIARELYMSQGESKWAELYLNYLRKPYNSDGFRSIAFDTSKTDKPRILIIGDSFAYGMVAQPLFNSYADILLSRGYIVYNTGIPNTDPAQYAAIVNKYVPLLKPDLVILNFYMGNDLMPFHREAKQEEPPEHLTNAGFFESNPTGYFMPVQECYEYYLSLVRIPDIKNKLFDRICSKSHVLSLLWGVLYEFNIVKHQQFDDYTRLHFGKSGEEKALITKKYIDKITRACNETNTSIIHTIIPKKPEAHFLHKNKKLKESEQEKRILKLLFSDAPYYYPMELIGDDYKEDDSHFNNKGSLKYADFLESLIQQYIQKKN